MENTFFFLQSMHSILRIYYTFRIVTVIVAIVVQRPIIASNFKHVLFVRMIFIRNTTSMRMYQRLLPTHSTLHGHFESHVYWIDVMHVCVDTFHAATVAIKLKFNSFKLNWLCLCIVVVLSYVQLRRNGKRTHAQTRVWRHIIICDVRAAHL